MGVFISPISKLKQEKDEYQFYYHLKELLLQKHIHSQVIYKEHIFKDVIEKYFMINIASAMLAKLGGIPWDINSDTENDLVIGVGAFKSKKFDTQYMGSAISYIPGQGLQKFDCVRKTETQHLAVQIRLMLQKMIDEEREVERIVIHFYKNMSHKELRPIKQVLFELGYTHIPIYIVSVNKTSNTDYLAFNAMNSELMPYSGTIIKIGHLEYLLFNNTLYPNETQYKVESWNLPLKLKIQSTHTDQLKDIHLVKHLIDQVYQFSRLYYKSVKQQNLPVTITYPEMMARIYPHFKNKSLGSFAKAYPWFL